MYHPDNQYISNGLIARLTIFFSRHRIPFVSKMFHAFFCNDISVALPKTTFLPHPYGIVVHGSTKLGNFVVIGHQVTIGARNGINKAPSIGDFVYFGAGAKVLGQRWLNELRGSNS